MEMNKETNAKLLRIFLGESDKYGNIPLYEAIVIEAKKQNLYGATVLKGAMGFGANSRIQSTKLFELSSDLPFIIEIVDTEEEILNFSKTVEHMFEKSKSGGMITIEKVEVIRYKASK